MIPYEAIIGLLKAKSIKFEELNHEPVYTSEQAARVRGLSLDSGAKSLLLKSKDHFVLVVVSGGKKIDSKKLKIALGTKKLRFATPAEVKDEMKCEVGACYPFGSIVKLDTYLDSSLLSQKHISFNPGVHNKSIKLKLNDYLLIEKPSLLDVSAGETKAGKQ
jgi:Ala-tRNA(Pro) deacylase